MGRYKMGPQGGYYDPNDSGPDQFTPTPGQQYPGMPQPQAPPQQSGGFQPPIDFPQLPGPHQGPWMPPIVDSGWDGTQTPKEMQPWQGPTPYTGGYDPNSPMYGKAGSFGGGTSLGSLGGGKMVYSPSAHESSWVTDEQLANSQRMQDEYARTGVMPQMPSFGGTGSIWGAMNPTGLSSLASLGASGGNVAPKPSGGLAGAIYNKYPDLFGKR